MAKTEKQVKYKINNFDYISKRLIEIEAIFIGGFMEKTIRYDNDDLKCSNNGIFIRTKSGMKNVLTLKEIPTDSSNTSFERITTEVEVDNINKIGYILEKIGLTKKFIMEKYRLFFKYDNVDILIDELPFGIYLEIKGEDNEINRITKMLNIDETDLIKMTYWDIYDKIKKDSKNENIVFETNHIFKIATYLWGG